MFLLPEGRACSRIHFIGVFGAGMSALAQYLAPECTVQGSDRAVGTPAAASMERILTDDGITLCSQDGSGISPQVDVLIRSTAIEEDNPDLAAARRWGIPVLHRSDLLAHLVARSRTVAVTGTSGKSSVSAMVWHILDAAGLQPSYIGGANLRDLVARKKVGNAVRGKSDLLVIEADESDGTVVKYRPEVAVILNVSRDHRDEAEVLSMMQTAACHAETVVAPADDSRLASLAAATFGFSDNADYHCTMGGFEHGRQRFSIGGVSFESSVPGRHTALNTAAAAAAAAHFGVSLQESARTSAGYGGIARRFDIIGSCRSCAVIDDYAHNPEKIRAAVAAARMLFDDLMILFQPHGYGPLRFLFDDFVHLFNEILRPGDTLVLLPVFYAGGTVDRSVEAADLAAAITTAASVHAPPRREDLLTHFAGYHRGQRGVLLTGARDRSLPAFAEQIHTRLKEVCHEKS
ncbi:MAG: Mur ligase family protein [Fibrobacterota bacterium]